MSRLLFIPKPLPEESPTSMFKRMAIRHGCVCRNDLRDLCGAAYPGGSIIYRNYPIVQQVANLIAESEDKEAFLSGFYATQVNFIGGPTVSVCGMELDDVMVRARGPAFCSECWLEGRDRFFKDLKLAVYCPYHARKYLDRCPVCRRSLAWPDLLSGQCDCPTLPESPRCTESEMELERRLLTYFNLHDAQGLAEFQRYFRLLGFRSYNSSACPATRTWALLVCALADGDEKSVLRHLNTLHQLYPEIPKRILCAKLSAISTAQSARCILTFLKETVSSRPDPGNDEWRAALSKFSLSRSQLREWQSINMAESKALRQLLDFTRGQRFDWQQTSVIAENLLNIRLNNTLERKPRVIGYTIKQVQQILVLTVPAIKGAVSEGLLTPIEHLHGTWYFTDEDLKRFSTKYISIQRVANESGYSVKQIRKSRRYFPDQDDGLTSPSVRLRIISVPRRDALLEWLNRSIKIRHHEVQPHHPLPHLKGDEAGIWVSVFDAARQLCVHPSVVKNLIRVGLLPCRFRLHRGNGYALSQTIVDEFANQYIGVREAMVILGCNQTTTTRLLKKNSILPVTGPCVDASNTHYFSRAKVAQLARSLKAFNTDQSDCYTMEEASKELHISVSTVTFLIRQGVLDSPDLIQKQCMRVKKSSVREFPSNYVTLDELERSLNLPRLCVRHLLGSEKISIIAPDRRRPHRLDIYRRDDVSLIFPELQDPNSKKIFKSNFISIKTLLSKYRLTAKDFFRLFIGSGFIRPIGPPRAQTHVTGSDAEKIATVLDEYLTFPQADKCLGHRHACENLVRKKKLTCERPMVPFNECKMIKRSVINEHLGGCSCFHNALVGGVP